MMRFCVLMAAAMLASGCVTVQNAKTLTVAPSAAPVTVTSVAQARCWDLFFVLYCQLKMEMETSDGVRVSDFRK